MVRSSLCPGPAEQAALQAETVAGPTVRAPSVAVTARHEPRDEDGGDQRGGHRESFRHTALL